MKKISLLTLSVAMAFGFTGCKDDTQPRLDMPTEFVLNTPSMANQTYIFRDDESFKNLNDITFTVSQPNYGVACTPNYQVQLAKDAADFEAWDAAEKSGDFDEDNAIAGSDELPLAQMLETVTTSAVINIPGTIFCNGVNALYGFDADNYKGESVPVAVRVRALLPNAPQSEIWSNVVDITVSSYIPVTEPGKLYMIGQYPGWDINSDAVYLEETGIGTKIYYGNVFIPAGDFQFRFYSALGDWESNSVGSQDDDSSKIVTFENGVYTGPIFMGKKKGDKLGKGSWQDPTWAGGNLEITVNTKAMTIEMKMAPPKQIYMVGNLNGWDINSDKCALKETPAGSNIFQGTVEAEAGTLEFAIYTELGDWENNYIGPAGGNGAFSLASGPYTGAFEVKKSNWKDTAFAGGKIQVTVDFNDNSIRMEAQ